MLRTVKIKEGERRTIGDLVYIKEGVAESYQLRGRALNEITDFHIVMEVNENTVKVAPPLMSYTIGE